MIPNRTSVLKLTKLLGGIHLFSMQHFGLIIIASLFATACTTVLHSTSQEDAASKAFTTKPGVANLYMFRDNRIWGAGVGWDVTLDGHLLGLLPTRTYMFREVQPGKHELVRNQAVFSISVSAGSNYFVRARSYSLEQVSEQEGRAVVSKLKLHRVDVPF